MERVCPGGEKDYPGTGSGHHNQSGSGYALFVVHRDRMAKDEIGVEGFHGCPHSFKLQLLDRPKASVYGFAASSVAGSTCLCRFREGGHLLEVATSFDSNRYRDTDVPGDGLCSAYLDSLRRWDTR